MRKGAILKIAERGNNMEKLMLVEFIEKEVTEYVEYLNRLVAEKEADYDVWYKKYMNQYNDNYIGLVNYELCLLREDYRLEKITKLVNKKYKDLFKRVEKKIGEVREVEEINGSTYYLVGEKGSCILELIVAGGYNIQRRHYRWLIK